MGSGGSKGYSVEEHGHDDRTMFDEYIADPNKFNDMSGKVVAITGTSSGGMGFYMGEIAIKKNAKKLICLNRDSKSAKKGEEGLLNLAKETKSPTIVQSITCDMQDLEVVKKAATAVNKSAQADGGLDVLICNSGIMATRDKRTKDGFEVQMQTNQLSHFLLTSLVWPSIEMAAQKRGEARVVTHSSSARDGPSKLLEERFFLPCDEGTLGGDDASMVGELVCGSVGPWSRYHQTKLANSCFAMELHNKLVTNGVSDKIKAMTADPGLASTQLQVSSTQGDGLMPAWAARMIMGSGHSAENGSLSCAMGAFSPEANSGDMYMPEQGAKGPPIKCISAGKSTKAGKEKLTCSETNQSNVWKWCEEGLDIKFDFSEVTV